jgi:hypothetical protein
MRQVIYTVILIVLAAVMFAPAAWAGKGTCDQDRTRDQLRDPAVCPVCQFVDANGDGVCDRCGTCIPKGDDADGDGIPNGQDPDYTPPKDGSGRR